MSKKKKRWAKGKKRRFTEYGIWIENNHIERCSTSLTFREIQVKITVNYHSHTRIRQLKYKIVAATNARKDV